MGVLPTAVEVKCCLGSMGWIAERRTKDGVGGCGASQARLVNGNGWGLQRGGLVGVIVERRPAISRIEANTLIRPGPKCAAFSSGDVKPRYPLHPGIFPAAPEDCVQAAAARMKTVPRRV